MIEEILFAAFMCAAWSILYKRSPIFTTIVHLQIGITLGFTIYTSIGQLDKMLFTPYWVKGILLTGGTVPAILGFLSWLRLTPNRTARAVARWPIAALAGIAAALAGKGAIGASILKQLVISVPKSPVELINTTLMVITTFTILSYFLYTFPRMTRGPLAYIPKVGRYLVMVAFGIAMGSFVMTVTTYTVGAMRDFVHPPYMYVIIIALILILVDIIYHRLR